MYNLRFTNPRLNGYIYRRKKRCGYPNCRCAKSEKYRHTAYWLQYRELVDGEWKRRSEYVPKEKVRALRARIKRAKQRDREAKEITQGFLIIAPRLVKLLERNINPDETLELVVYWAKTMSKKKLITQLSALQSAKVATRLLDVIIALSKMP